MNLNSAVIWFKETRPHFLLLTPVIVCLGTVIAWKDGFFSTKNFLLALAGMLLLHIGVNTLNDYFDYESGRDIGAHRTPFSGGSGILPNKLLKPKNVYFFGLTSLLLGVTVGFYFILTKGILLLPIVVVAAFSAYFYTTHICKVPVGEIVTGMNFGPLAVLGSYFVQTATYSFEALIASIIPGLLVGNLLLLNQFPDVEKDSMVGRKHLVIVLGRRKASYLFSSIIILTYLWLILSIMFNVLPSTTVIGLATIPLGFKSIKVSLTSYEDMQGLIPAMASNVMNTLLTPALVSVGYLISGFI